MSIHLQKIRLIITTKDEPYAGTDSEVELRFYVNHHSRTTFPTKGWHKFKLDNPWNDRERGRTDMYEIDFEEEVIEGADPTAPRGIAFNNFEAAHSANFRLKIKGNDWWKIDQYTLLGYFLETKPIPASGAGEEEVIDHGWRLMAQRDDDLEMSTDESEGVASHSIVLNGTF
jgi:hypothetical protein